MRIWLNLGVFGAMLGKRHHSAAQYRPGTYLNREYEHALITQLDGGSPRTRLFY